VSKNISIRFLIVLPVLAFLAFVLTVADLGALAQNTNSSTPPEEGTQNDNAQNDNMQNMNANAPTGRRRRGRRRAAPIAATDSTGEAAPAGDSGMGAQETDTGVGAPGEAADLSGTWSGRLRMTGGHEMSGEGTLTITGNQFTLTSEGMSHSGRVIAITTRGYTGAAFIFSDIDDPGSNTKLACSVRVRQGRNSLTLTPVPGARNRLNFNGRASAGS
jgi:hypothetical protein